MPPRLRHIHWLTNPGAAISAKVSAMNAITLATMSSVTTDLRPVVQRGMKGWMRGEPMWEKLARRKQLSNHFGRKWEEKSKFQTNGPHRPHNPHGTQPVMACRAPPENLGQQ